MLPQSQSSHLVWSVANLLYVSTSNTQIWTDHMALSNESWHVYFQPCCTVLSFKSNVVNIKEHKRACNRMQQRQPVTSTWLDFRRDLGNLLDQTSLEILVTGVACSFWRRLFSRLVIAKYSSGAKSAATGPASQLTWLSYKKSWCITDLWASSLGSGERHGKIPISCWCKHSFSSARACMYWPSSPEPLPGMEGENGKAWTLLWVGLVIYPCTDCEPGSYIYKKYFG